MQIGINGTVVGSVVTGVTRYVTELTNHLSASEDVTVYTRTCRDALDGFGGGARD